MALFEDPGKCRFSYFPTCWNQDLPDWRQSSLDFRKGGVKAKIITLTLAPPEARLLGRVCVQSWVALMRLEAGQYRFPLAGQRRCSLCWSLNGHHRGCWKFGLFVTIVLWCSFSKPTHTEELERWTFVPSLTSSYRKMSFGAKRIVRERIFFAIRMPTFIRST